MVLSNFRGIKTFSQIRYDDLAKQHREFLGSNVEEEALRCQLHILIYSQGGLLGKVIIYPPSIKGSCINSKIIFEFVLSTWF